MPKTWLCFVLLLWALCVHSVVAQTSTITIVKAASPHDAQDFAFKAFGPNGGCCAPFQLDDDAGAPGANNLLSNSKTFNVAPGTYSFMEDFNNPVPVTGWVLSGVQCSPASGFSFDPNLHAFTVNVAAGSHVTCTFTNTKVPPSGTVTITKVLVPAGDPGRFILRLYGPGGLAGQRLNAGNGATLGPISVLAGTYHITELPNSTWTSLSDYTATYSGAGCAANGAVTVTPGAHLNCTLTNTRHVTYPNTATVTIHNAMAPFGPQLVDIAVGGTVTFINANSGANWIIQPWTGSPNFTHVPLNNNTTGVTAPFTTPNTTYTYEIHGVGVPSFVVHGIINVH